MNTSLATPAAPAGTEIFERILAAPPRQSLVLLLAALGAITTLFQNFFHLRFAPQLLYWPVLLGFVVLGAAGGIVGLYGSALLLGRRL